MSVIVLIFAVFVIDRVSNNFLEQKDMESQMEYEKFIQEADSALTHLDEAERIMYELTMKDSIDVAKIDSLKKSLAASNKLSDLEKQELLDRIRAAETRNLIDERNEVVVKVEERTRIKYKDVYVDTVIYRYSYIDSIVYVTDTVVKVDTIIIEDQKSVNKIKRKYGK
jgi:hypothetical protein